MKHLLLSTFVLLSFNISAQEWNPKTTTVEGTVTEMLELISAEKCDWEKFRGLFLSSAHFMVASENTQMGIHMQSFALEDFVRLFQKSAGKNFNETQLNLQIEEYNGIAQAWQTYEVSVGEASNKGINSYQLVYHADRWWIASFVWTNNTNGISIPEKYLPEEKN